ncbi:MAG: hypothetical protein GY852_11670, partial [bacterium]|nr:hypothetical protein [bacterium]
MFTIRIIVLSLTVIAVAGALACNDAQPDEIAEPDSHIAADTLYLTVTDTIGVYQGDPSYVFGDIGNASFTAAGDIIVLDRMNSVLSFFTPGGEFITTIGGMGESPWEFHWAASFAPMYDSHLIVSDYAGR